MKNAFLKTSNNSAPSNKPSLRFEIHSLPSTHPSSSSQQKWYIKANHPTEASRWITAIRACMDWYTKRDDATPNLTVAGAEVEMIRRASGESYSDSKSVYSFVKSNRPQFLGRPSMVPTGLSISVSGTGGDADSIHVASAVDPVAFLPAERGEEDGDEDMETSSTDTGARGLGQAPPFEAECEIAANSVVMQLEAVQQLVVGCFGSTMTAPGHLLQPLAMEPSVSSSRSIQSSGVSVSSSKASSHKAQPHLHPPAPTPPPAMAVPLPLSVSPLPTSVSSTTSHPHEPLVLTSFDQLSTLLDKHLQIVSVREEWYKKKLRSERRRQSVWEESLKTVVREGEMLENELRERRRRRGSVRVGELDLGSGRRRTETIKATQGVGPFAVEKQQPAKTMEPVATTLQQQPARVGLGTMVEEEEEYDDSEDEFFDAIESNNLPGLVIPRPLSTLSSPARLPSYISEEPYSGMCLLTLICCPCNFFLCRL